MDATLHQILHELYEAHKEIDRLRAQISELLKQIAAKDAA